MSSYSVHPCVRVHLDRQVAVLLCPPLPKASHLGIAMVIMLSQVAYLAEQVWSRLSTAPNQLFRRMT